MSRVEREKKQQQQEQTQRFNFFIILHFLLTLEWYRFFLFFVFLLPRDALNKTKYQSDIDSIVFYGNSSSSTLSNNIYFQFEWQRMKWKLHIKSIYLPLLTTRRTNGFDTKSTLDSCHTYKSSSATTTTTNY